MEVRVYRVCDLVLEFKAGITGLRLRFGLSWGYKYSKG